MARNTIIARCIVQAILAEGKEHQRRSFLARILAWIITFFSIYRVPLQRFKRALFADLRKKAWLIQESAYAGSFTAHDGAEDDEALQKMGTMGFSGSVSVA